MTLEDAINKNGENPLVKPKGVTQQQWGKALDLYNAAKERGDKFPELTVAQAALESAWFKKTSGNLNYFGQKASRGQKGRDVVTHEVAGNKRYKTTAKFRDYDSIGEAVDDRIRKWSSKYDDANTVSEAIYKIWQYDPETGRGKGYATDNKYDSKIKTILGMMGVPLDNEGSKQRRVVKDKPVGDVRIETARAQDVTSVTPRIKRADLLRFDKIQAIDEERKLREKQILDNIGNTPTIQDGAQDEILEFDEDPFAFDPYNYIQLEEFQKGGEKEEGYSIKDFAKDAYEAWINPKNFGVEDYTKSGDFDSAYKSARQDGKKNFIYKNRRYNTDYDGTPAEQLRETGITDDQIQKPNFFRSQLSKNLAPKGYENKVKRVTDALLGDREEREEFEAKIDNPDHKRLWEANWNKRRLDAHNLYTGVPQKYDTFSVSDYKPTSSKDDDTVYYNITTDGIKAEAMAVLKTDDKHPGYIDRVQEDDTGVMGNFRFKKGEDEKGKYISYYDKWDISPIDYGKPLEIYDRIYYKENSKEEVKEAEKELKTISAEEDRLYEELMNEKDKNKIGKIRETMDKLRSRHWKLTHVVNDKYTLEDEK